MTSYLGVDWAGGCWVVVEAGDEPNVTTEPSIYNVWHEHGKGDDVQSILVDIPIGLPENDTRDCDTEAKERLGSRSSTVFTIPPRDVVEADDYETAKENNGGSLGSQSWWLFPRILEADVFLQENADAREKIYESHPEVCFDDLSDDELSSKSDGDGVEARLNVLKQATSGSETLEDLYDEVEDVVEERSENAEWHHRISKGRVDDVLDAAVLAVTAAKIGLQDRSDDTDYPTLPDDPTEDEELGGIPMEIVYPGESE
ncbi:DUF429 domain-containing protein [Haloferax sp. MBLA0076]|uniref:DUF429 domain-containing protein n=1 Tax=Haloferax litoreum TaxID=2666140 RepID=A0A6A8GJ46_9EURY|nr:MULTISPECIES: DUF429 domain-containing protein [Haloferax]KAB1193632.1 DUF429 domain-containing protein [Haloferax sp. CBA1148]MRX22157.1 DUF429 domain-containing protein [Haloferax litoreum]